MACFHPVTAYRLSSGEVVFAERGDVLQTLSLPCGRCNGCRLERARMWSVRITHEAQMHGGRNSFLTLTYSDDYLPSDWSLRYSDFQRFMRRVRREFGPTRFFMCGEYGEELGRPHYHCGLFGVDFRADRKPFRKTDAGFQVYRSATLERLWPLGNAEIGDLTLESAAYMARYTFKKVTGARADAHYERVDRETGEVVWRVPEFCHMSLKPGIGATWFARFRGDVFPHDRVVVGGQRMVVPRYYYTLLGREDPQALEDVQQARIMRAAALGGKDTTVERLADREKVTEARLSFYKRK